MLDTIDWPVGEVVRLLTVKSKVVDSIFTQDKIFVR